MMKYRRSALAVACAAAVMVAGVRSIAAQDALPKGTDLLAKSVAAMGGVDAVKAIKSFHAKGTFEMPAQNISGTVDLIQGRPSSMRMTIDIQGIGQADQGSDGKIAWSVDPMSGPSLLGGKALADAKAEAMFDGQLFGPDYVKSATTLEKTKFGDRPAYKIKLVTTFDTERTLYLDAESFLVIGSEAMSETPMGSMPTVTSSGAYKKFGALMQPTTIVQTAMGFDQVIRITSIEYDTVPASAFEPPAAVKALIK
jgi:hypothetical protein